MALENALCFNPTQSTPIHPNPVQRPAKQSALPSSQTSHLPISSNPNSLTIRFTSLTSSSDGNSRLRPSTSNGLHSRMPSWISRARLSTYRFRSSSSYFGDLAASRCFVVVVFTASTDSVDSFPLRCCCDCSWLVRFFKFLFERPDFRFERTLRFRVTVLRFD